MYVGKSTTNIASRLYRHTRDDEMEFNNISVYFMENTSNINIIEPYLIEKYKPAHNTDCKSTHDCTVTIDDLDKVIDSQLNYSFKDETWQVCTLGD